MTGNRLIGGRLADGDQWVWVHVPQLVAKRSRITGMIVGAVMALATLIFATQMTIGGASANPGAVIDFESLTEGQIVNSVSCGSGITCSTAVVGSVAVNGVNPKKATNAAMVFDGTCTPGGAPANCTGADDDLYFPSQGNILIVSEDLDGSDPDDNIGGQLEFDFSGFGPGTVTINSLVVMDIDNNETGGTIKVYSGGPGGTLVTTVDVPVTGNNGKATVPILDVGDFMRVTLIGSGAVDDINVETEVISGRMTGGGSVFTVEGVRVTRGFEIHCDLSDPNNIEVNWQGGNKFHLTDLTAGLCTEDPAIIQDPPAAPFDTFTGDGVGKLNGTPGATIHFVFVDAGEPGKNDTALIQIWNSGGTKVLDVSGFIDVGNLQAH